MNLSWDEYFFLLVDTVALKSKDPDTKVGCVIVGPDKEIRTTGYNSFPRGIRDNVVERTQRPAKYLWIEHSERNAVYNAARMGTSLKDCISYQSWYPCANCASALINVGIKEIVVDFREANPWFQNDRWDDSMEVSKTMLDEAFVKIRKWRG